MRSDGIPREENAVRGKELWLFWLFANRKGFLSDRDPGSIFPTSAVLV